MKNKTTFTLLVLGLFLFSLQAYSQNQSNSQKLKELPPGHQLRIKYNSLPPQAKVKAENWLDRFSFPEEDFSSIRLDNEGGVFYAEPDLRNVEGLGSTENSTPETSEVTSADIFLLHSKPGATNVVHVNFEGHIITGTAWNGGSTPTLYARPYDSNGNDNIFSANEISDMAAIWHRIAEDYSPFDVDVTTERPSGGYGPNVGHILITNRTDENGNYIYQNAAGGVAYVGVWGRSNFTYYQPALVFYNHLGSSNAHNIAEASSHELGHNLSLGHDGASGTEYYQGHGSGNTSWAPIMGVGYYRNVTQWSNGNYPGSNNQQDDLAVLVGHLGLSPDDHGNTTGSASALIIGSGGIVSVIDPEDDPFNATSDNKGVIGNSSDEDFFFFETSGGQTTLAIKPSWQAYNYESNRGSNLDVRATLYNQTGGIINTYGSSTDTDANISVNLSAGKYYLGIEGEGSSNYSDYGSGGLYYISGLIEGGGDKVLLADFSYTSSDLSVDFTDLSTEGDNPIISWSWDFGDLSTSSLQNPSHLYGADGSFTVTLMVTDDQGATASTQQVIDVCLDTDDDGVCDALDGCPDDADKTSPGDCGCGIPDTDSDGDGIADCIDDCINATQGFPGNSLTHSGGGSNSTSVSLPANSNEASFTISNISGRAKPTAKSYTELVTVTYVDGLGNIQTYGSHNANQGSTFNVEIPGTVQSITVSLIDQNDGNSGSSIMSVSLSVISYCEESTPCNGPDSDGDGVCDEDDLCPLDPLKITPGECGCDIPEGSCDGCVTQTNLFPSSQLTHVGANESSLTLDFAETRTEVSFTISGINKKGGKPSTRYTDIVTVNYVDGGGNTQTYGVFSGTNVSSANISIAEPVQSVTVSLADGYDGDSGSTTLSVDLSEVSSCGPAGGKSGYINQSIIAEAAEDIKLYPNPTSGRLFIKGLNEPTDIKVYSFEGKLIRRYEKIESTIDISGLPAGFYYLNLSNANKTYRNKIVIKN